MVKMCRADCVITQKTSSSMICRGDCILSQKLYSSIICSLATDVLPYEGKNYELNYQKVKEHQPQHYCAEIPP
jgi:hypothetical protein